jgi:hypothetical protein
MPDLEQLPLIQDIPDPETVRSRLAQIVREQAILRGLLRLSQRKQQAVERDRQQRCEGGAHVA